MYMKWFLSLCAWLFLISCSNTTHFVATEPLSLFSELDESDQSQRCDTDDCMVTENFYLEDSQTAIDIVFVLDVSQSMKKELQKLGESMRSILSYINDFDWRMAFTTADHGDHQFENYKISSEERWQDYRGDEPWFGRFMHLEYEGHLLPNRFLSSNHSAAEGIFYSTLTINPGDQSCRLAPFCQRDHEQPLRALQATIERSENREFFRPNADLVAIIITNEDERSEDPERATTAQDVLRSFQSVFSDEKNLHGFGIIVKNNHAQCYNQQKRKTHTVRYGVRVAELAKLTNGRNMSICEGNYGPTLTNISQFIKSKILNSVHLTRGNPVPESIKITLTPYQDVRWKLQDRQLVFSTPLQKGTQVEVTYQLKEFI